MWRGCWWSSTCLKEARDAVPIDRGTGDDPADGGGRRKKGVGALRRGMGPKGDLSGKGDREDGRSGTDGNDDPRRIWRRRRRGGELLPRPAGNRLRLRLHGGYDVGDQSFLRPDPPVWERGAEKTLPVAPRPGGDAGDRKSTRLNSSHGYISYAVF